LPTALRPPMTGRALLAMTLLWLLALGSACALDKPVAEAVNQTSIPHRLQDKKHLKPLAKVWKEPGEYVAWIAVGLVVMFIHPLRWRAGAWVLLGTGLSAHNMLIKWVVGRTRPFKLDPESLAQPFTLHPFRDGLPGLFHQTNLSFPSGHASVVFAGAATLSILWPKKGWAFYAIAIAVGIERILELGHWCSDVVGAAALSVVLVHLLWMRLARSTPPPAGV
jgi:membrane-associated phospholipid phosphatase